MKVISLLKNPIQEYAWGSLTAIPALLGREPSDKPQAELWMGAHPKAPSQIQINGIRVSLLEFIEKNPDDILGPAAAKRFNNKLPYLFKVLAAAKPLSIQAHPSKEQAVEGFERENGLQIPLNAPHRNYRDDNHKPELICALTPFWALNGFRKTSEIHSLLKKICPNGLEEALNILAGRPNSSGLRCFFEHLMKMKTDRKKRAIGEALVNAKDFAGTDPVSEWIIKLHNEYAEDMGIFAPAFLNLICLEPGQAMFLPAGQLHAYLDGVGIELMANSDNVLRGGLTPKHVDVTELLKVLLFEETILNILIPEKASGCEGIYITRTEEFVLSVIIVKNDRVYEGRKNRSVEILLCTEGQGSVSDPGSGETLDITKGTSLIVPAAVEQYTIGGALTLYKAAVPLGV